MKEIIRILINFVPLSMNINSNLGLYFNYSTDASTMNLIDITKRMLFYNNLLFV